MQEVRRLGNDSICHQGYNIYWSGLKQRREQGVAIGIRESTNFIVEGIIYESARAMAIDLTIRGCKIQIISLYAPTEDKSLASKQTFYKSF